MEPTSSSPAEDRDSLDPSLSFTDTPEPNVSFEEPVPPAPAEAAAPYEAAAPVEAAASFGAAAPEEAAVVPADLPLTSEPMAPSPLDLGEAAPVAAAVPDLSAAEAKPPASPAPATNLDLPSLQLPHPMASPTPAPVQPAEAYPPARAVSDGPVPAGQPGAAYSEDLARQAYGEPSYSQPQFGQQPGAQPGAQPGWGGPAAPPAYGQVVPVSPLSAADESTWATAAHWSTLVASLITLPFLGPLLILLIQGPKSARVRANAVESLNFDLTMMIGMLASFVLMLVLIGFVTAPIIAVLWLVFKIVATVQASSGQDYRYPFNIRMVK